jgi:hypothetical protein
VEETDMSGGGDHEGDRHTRERWSREREQSGLREFLDEKQNDTGQADIYRFKNIRSGFNPEPLLIDLESRPKRFWFKTVIDECTINSGSQLELLLISLNTYQQRFKF